MFTLLFEKGPPIVVDRSGGLSLLSAGHPGARTLVSGNGRAPDEST